jgi:hypothetical protein
MAGRNESRSSTSLLVSRRATSIAGHSPVNSSIAVSMRNALPSRVLACRKSIDGRAVWIVATRGAGTLSMLQSGLTTSTRRTSGEKPAERIDLSLDNLPKGDHPEGGCVRAVLWGGVVLGSFFGLIAFAIGSALGGISSGLAGNSGPGRVLDGFFVFALDIGIGALIGSLPGFLLKILVWMFPDVPTDGPRDTG